MDLLQLWQNIREEANDLAEAMERLPDHCDSGNAEAHLTGHCDCCNAPGPTGHSQKNPDCLAILGRLGVDLKMLNQDLAVAGPSLDVVAQESKRTELRRGILLAAGDLQALNEAFKRLTESVVGFRRECTISRMRTVRRHSLELRDHCERINAELPDQQTDDNAADKE